MVFGLHKMNTIYVGIKNPIDIAMDGFTLDKLKTTAVGCTLILDTLNIQHYLTATREGICNIYLTFKKAGKIKHDSIKFKIERLPRPESLYGDLESGGYSINELIGQDAINATIYNFYVPDIEYQVLDFDALFVPKRGDVIPFNSIKNQLPMELKFRIMNAKKGDKILIDNISALRPDWIKVRLAPIVLSIESDYEEPNKITYDFQNVDESKDTTFKNSFDNDPWEIYKSGITRGYLKDGADSQLVFELNKSGKKILWEKHFYPSGKQKAIYNFENNDTLGEAISYYENGKIKSKGNILPKSKNIYTYYRKDIEYGHCYMDYDHMHFMDSFFLINYVPFGHWLCYSENGNIRMDCNIALYYHGKMPMSKNDSAFDISSSNLNRKKANINTALINKDCYFTVGFDSIFKTYNHRGQLLQVEYFNYKPEIPKSYQRYSYYGEITHNEYLESYEYYDNGNLLSESKSDIFNDEQFYKTYYLNGKIKEESVFKKNTIVGQAKSYYDNGNLKAEGKIIKKVFPDEYFWNNDSIRFFDTIKVISEEKIGIWKVYHPNGNMGMECNYKLFGWMDLERQLKYYRDLLEEDVDAEIIDEVKLALKEYLPDDVINHPDNKFYSKLSGACYIYSEQGKLIKTINFNE